ncbi:MAG: MATE family efflux transporter [Ruminococcus sp.]
MEKVIERNKMGYMKMFPLILSMSLPAMFSMTIQALYNVVDSIFVGHLADGQYALEATSYAYPLQMLLIAVAVGTAVGTNSLISRRLGAGRQNEADLAATHGIVLAVFSWLIFLLIGLFAVKPFFNAYGCNDTVYTYGTQYLTIVLTCSLFSLIQVSIEKSIQATGDMIFPMLFQLSGAITNIIFDPLLIFGIGPFPELKVMGAAIATVFGQFVSVIFSIIVLCVRKNKIRISFKNFKLNINTIKNIYSVGLPSIVMQSVGSVMTIGLNAILSAYQTAVTVFGVYFKLQSFVFMPCFGLNQGVLPVMGFNYGAKNKKRLYSALKCGIGIAFVIMLIGTIIFWVIPDVLLGMFNGDASLITTGVPAFKTISLCFIPASFGILFISFFQATGKGIRALIISFTRQLVFLLPIAYILSAMFNDVDYVWYAFPLAEILSLVLAILLFINLAKTDIKKLDK